MKLFRSLKYRFILLFSLFVLALCGVLTFVSVYNITDIADKIFAEEGIYIVTKAAQVIDGDAFERLAKTLDENDPYYEKTRLGLLSIKNATGCHFLYTMAPAQGTVYRYIIDGSAPPDDKENFSALGSEEDTAEYDAAFAKCWKEKSIQVSGIQYQEGWGRLISIYAPILNSGKTMVGIVGCDFSAEALSKEIRSHALRQSLVALCFMAAGFGLMLLFLRLIFGRLSIINTFVREISEGAGDLTRKIKILRQDEIDELAVHFNMTLEKIRQLVIAIKGRTSSLFIIGNELNENMIKTSTEIRQITSSIESTKEQVKNQSESVTETNEIMGQVTQSIDRLNTHVEMQTASVAQSSSAIEEMLANIESVTQTLIRNTENVNELTGASEEGRKSLEEVSADIREIARESEGLLEINAVIKNIANQTNLLSMNAAIEAAHAGEAGRGFAVVADEIRKLSENSGTQSRTISEVLNKIKKSIDKITKSTAAVLEKFQAIDSRIGVVSDQEENIRNAMEEQGQGSHQILEAIGKLNELTRQVKDSSGQMLQGSKEVINESQNLESITLKLLDGINVMAAGAENIDTAVSNVNEACQVNKEHLDGLVEEVSKFKVE